jgi:choloylglycine hydrolase
MTNYYRTALALIAFLTALSLAPTADACTRALWTKDGQPVIVGRNMDWMEDMGTNLWSLPRGIERNGLAGKNSVKWTSKYGSLVATGYDIGVCDGMNEEGLVVNALWLAESNFGKRDEALPGLSISLWTQYYLDNFKSVADAVNITKTGKYQLVPVTFWHSKKMSSTVHLSLSDKSGDSAIIEFVDGKPVVHHGKQYTVMTNSPTFDKQLENAKQYQGLGGDKPLPGTTDATDRFVRAAYYVKNLPTPKNNREAVAGVLSVMRNASAPFGTADPARPNISTTIWRTVADQTNGVNYFESTANPNIVWVRMNKLNFDKGTPVTKLDLVHNPDLVGEVSTQFKPTTPFKFLPASDGEN